jgi:hypothetical protein
MNIRKKLIEVSIPLEAINAASAREKSIRHGHPSTLHLWWARRPLAACRAVLFAQLVDDPSAWPDRFIGEETQEAGSCPRWWCKSAGSLWVSGGFGRLCHAATAGSLTKGSSLKGAMVSRVM